jgi:hypothetical protein
MRAAQKRSRTHSPRDLPFGAAEIASACARSSRVDRVRAAAVLQPDKRAFLPGGRGCCGALGEGPLRSLDRLRPTASCPRQSGRVLIRLDLHAEHRSFSAPSGAQAESASGSTFTASSDHVIKASTADHRDGRSEPSRSHEIGPMQSHLGAGGAAAGHARIDSLRSGSRSS